MKSATGAVTILATAALICAAQAYPSFQSRIPNGNRVPDPCKEGAIWGGVGHQSPAGANARNPFGLDFAAAGFMWTVDLCRKDSDGDGLTNGQELGDPDCVWTSGAAPARTTGLSHPGICPLDTTKCKNMWTVCPKAFSCPAMSDPSVTVRNFTINKNTPVPAKETTYICQAFELNNTASPVHMIGSRPIIDNKNIMHHMIIYACRNRPESSLFYSPQVCFMGNSECQEVLNLWAYGLEGECFNSNAGLRVGGNGYRYGLLELHWNNPKMTAGFTDSSGFSLYFTQSMRKHDLGNIVHGESHLVIPPRQPLVSISHTCPSVCTSNFHLETLYITSTIIHMHTYGIKGRISLWRSGALIQDLSPLQVYDYNSPKMIMFDPPVEYRKGDEVKTECYFNTMRSNNTVFFGESTSDEMCFSFLSFYPKHANKMSTCTSTYGINLCWKFIRPANHVERDCNITAMLSGDMPEKVYAEMDRNNCFKRIGGCDPVCRNYLNNTLWPANSCYDPNRARQMAEAMAFDESLNPSRLTRSVIKDTLLGQRFCEQEIKMLADTDRQAALSMPGNSPPPRPSEGSQTGGLTSKHLLIIVASFWCWQCWPF